ncbi:MAG: fumarylacetoacetate hydrolase family protein [Propionibacteriaceae bacterium]|nr:fumarylacetoacetate hydrolase family protein [Propionibacteriaceae bacterium]
MRIARFAATGKDPAYGTIELAVDGGEHPDTIAVLSNDPLAGGTAVNYTGERHHLEDVRLLAPLIPRSKIIGAASNFWGHGVEKGGEVPAVPSLFLKPNTSIVGPNDPIIIPEGHEHLNFEGEVAIVIGRICKQVPRERVSEVIFGYTIANDVSQRDWQKSDSQWIRAKGADTFCPVGPWINTHLSIEEASNLSIQTRVSDEIRQDGNSSGMVHGIVDLVCFISSFTTLLPGDLILTGTPKGFGDMRDGDVVEVEIDGLGTLSNPVSAA